MKDFGYGLALVTLVMLPLFATSGPAELSRFARVTPPVLAVVLVVTVLGLVATRFSNAAPALVGGGLAMAAALLQLAQAGRDTNLLAGNGSTFSLLLGLGLGWLGLAMASRGQQRVKAS